MKKITKIYEVFNYDELSEKSKEKAFLDYSYNNNDFFDFYYEDFKNNLLYLEELEKLKYINDIDIIECNLDYGGYVKLNVSININKYINYHNLDNLKPLIDIFEDETAVFNNNSNDINLLYDNFYYELASQKNIDNITYDNLLEELEKNLIEDMDDLKYTIYKIMKKEYEYYMSVDYFIELCNANDYSFLEDGTMFNE